MATQEEVYAELKQVFDPEIPVNIVDLGLIYDVAIDGSKCNITMSLTSQSCPEAQNIPTMIERRLNAMSDINETAVEVVWEPAWTVQMVSAEGRAILGIDEDQ